MRAPRILVWVLLAACAAGCGPLYGGKAEKLKPPTKKPRPPEAEIAAVPVKYIEDCTVNFATPPVKANNNSAARAAAENAEQKVDESIRSDDPRAQVAAVEGAISAAKTALKVDPYNANATLQLARAYDRALRKGCALALLKRLSALETAVSYDFARDAKAALDRVSDNPKWFSGYRKDAMSAAGR
ncbi:MAG: hypothetical protein IPI49_04470 [Myxococcales bacterium]|nr:hypothetical protein [Myxococcales bacterium]